MGNPLHQRRYSLIKLVFVCRLIVFVYPSELRLSPYSECMAISMIMDSRRKTPFFPVVPIMGIIFMIGLALYLLVTAPFSWLITALWVVVGFSLYKTFTFRREVEHYYPIITSERILVRKDFRILVLCCITS